MKKITVFFMSVFTGFLGLAQIETPAPSPSSTLEQMVGLTKVTVTYSRPSMRGRTVFGDLVPFDKVWRTGANEATILSTSKEITFGREKLDPGEYTLWTIPNEDSWTVIVNSEIGQWGVNMEGKANRNPEKDVFSVETGVIKSDKVFEQFTMAFEEIHDELELVLVWDQTMIIVPIDIGN